MKATLPIGGVRWETGTGKSFLAELLHWCSRRAGRFEDVSAGEDDELASDRLFGHARAAFTGAVGKRVSVFLEAGGGALLLDYFHLLRRSTPYRPLRTLERRAFKLVGVDRDVPMACRLVFGIGAEPDRLVADRRLLPDLRYRLGHCVVRIPPLAERREELALLVQRFLVTAQVETRLGDGLTRLCDCALGALERASWPGNVRDLKQMVIRAYLYARGRGPCRSKWPISLRRSWGLGVTGGSTGGRMWARSDGSWSGLCAGRVGTYHGRRT